MPQIDDFDKSKLKSFLRSSKDKQLASIARKANAKYISSTSSISSVLAHLILMVTGQSKINTSEFTPDLVKNVSARFSPFLNGGTEVNLIYKEGIYSIDATVNKETTILMDLVI